MTESEALKIAETIARPHNWVEHGKRLYVCGIENGGTQCTCGRDSEVKAIAKALQSAYERGTMHGIMAISNADNATGETF